MEMVGDVGGMVGVFTSIFGLLIFPISEHLFLINLISDLFVARTNDQNIFKETTTQDFDFDKNMENLNKKNKKFYFINLDYKSNIFLFLLKQFVCLTRFKKPD